MELESRIVRLTGCVAIGVIVIGKWLTYPGLAYSVDPLALFVALTYSLLLWLPEEGSQFRAWMVRP